MTDAPTPAPADQPPADQPTETDPNAQPTAQPGQPQPDQGDTAAAPTVTPDAGAQPPTADPAPASTTPSDNPPMNTETNKPAVADWPETAYDPASPQFDAQPGTRLKVHANVAIFDLQAGDESEVFDVPEVRDAARTGLLVIIEE